MKVYISAIFFSLLTFSAFSQEAGSPYSVYGIGGLKQSGVTFNTMKGGLGISSGKTYVVNNINPALLPMNSFTIFDFGIQYENRNISTDSLSQTNKGGGLNYLVLAVPLKINKSALSIGMSPYSIIKYNVNSTREVFNDTTQALYTAEGSGGLNQIYVQTGYRISDQLFAGVKIGYLIGTRTNETAIVPNSEFGRGNYPTSYFSSEKVRGFLLELGAAYVKKLKNDKFLSLGAIYELKSSPNVKRTAWFGNDVDIELSDTLEIVENVKGNLVLPSRLGLGLSYYKEYNWGIGIDYYMQDWNEFEDFMGSSQGLQKSFIWIMGGEYTPDFFSVNSYWKRVTFLAGVNYSKTPLSFENEDIFNFGINFGVSLPLANGSTINLGFTSGQLGTTKNNLVQEKYYKVSLGISFNDQSYGWYRKQRKFN